MTAPLIGISISDVHPGLTEKHFQAVLPAYPHAVAMGGGLPSLIPLNLDEPTLRALFDRCDGIVLTGGGDVDPKHYQTPQSPYTVGIIDERDRTEILLARWAVEQDKPLLAICRGIQVLNVALGGTLIQDILDELPQALRHDAPDGNYSRIMHEVEVIPGTKLYDAVGSHPRLSVNSLHHQALKQVAAPLEVTACAPDGLVEGVEHPDRRFIVGVQWHPEAMVTEHAPMLNLFRSLTRAASR